MSGNRYPPSGMNDYVNGEDSIEDEDTVNMAVIERSDPKLMKRQ